MLAQCTPSEPTKCFLDISKDGRILFSVTVKSGSGPNDGTKSPVAFTILGTKGKGQKKIISYKGIPNSSSKSATFNSNDVGSIVGFELALEENGRLSVVYVKIQNMSIFYNKNL